jgi:tRNA modification GTPase
MAGARASSFCPRVKWKVSERDTIFAVATGAGRGALAVMRLSGPDSGAALDALCGRRPAARRASLRTLRAADGDVLDEALALWFPAPGSYTGEDSAELHLHAGRAVIAAVADALVGLGLRPAEPGEFTRRAFLNGRMDLLEAEAVADLVAAETQAQRRQALRQMEGALGALYCDWAARLRLVLAQQEALIDFPDEDLPAETEAAMLGEIAALEADIARHLDDRRRGERVREGLTFVIAGPPNAGKSSLLNALARREAAIVSPMPGTTRDAVEVRLELGGVLVTLVDTAGLREVDDTIEAEGVRRARKRAAEADLVIMLRPVDAVADDAAAAPETGGAVLEVTSKIDLAVVDALPGVSAVTGEGIAALEERLAAVARSLVDGEGPAPLTRERHRAALMAARACLERARDACLVELRGEELRGALRELGRITGAVNVEDILEVIFGRFCIGK